jgi:hypothetical protein
MRILEPTEGEPGRPRRRAPSLPDETPETGNGEGEGNGGGQESAV